jgi:hypothetical protein
MKTNIANRLPSTIDLMGLVDLNPLLCQYEDTVSGRATRRREYVESGIPS